MYTAPEGESGQSSEFIEGQKARVPRRGDSVFARSVLPGLLLSESRDARSIRLGERSDSTRRSDGFSARRRGFLSGVPEFRFR